MALKKPYNPLVLALPDLALMFLALYLTVQARHDDLSPERWGNHLWLFSIVHVIWLVVLLMYRAFDADALRRYTTVLFRLLSAMAVNFLAAVVFFYYQPGLLLTPRRFLLLDVAIAFLLMLSWHLVVKGVFRYRVREKVYYRLSLSEENNLLAETSLHSYLGFEPAPLPEDTWGLEKGTVIVSEELRGSPELLAKVYDLRMRGFRFFDFQNFYELLTRKVYLGGTSEYWLISNVEYHEKRLYSFIKRAFDILAGIVLLPVFVITYPIAALLVKWSTGGSVFFTQERMGERGKPFTIYKYRTMKAGTPTDMWTEEDDRRITRIGKAMRKIHFDELPQVINLLSGRMSLVGPRPEQVEISRRMAQEIPFFAERLMVKPGLSGWAQLNVYAGSVEQSRLKLQYDLYYIKNRSLILDMEIILKTIHEVFVGKGR